MLLYRRETTDNQTEILLGRSGTELELWVNGCVVWRGSETYQGEHDRSFPEPKAREQ